MVDGAFMRNASVVAPASVVLSLASLACVSGCFTIPVRVRGEDAVRRVRFEVAYSTQSPPDRGVLDEFVTRDREVAPGVDVSWVLGDRVEARERWTEDDQEACARQHRHLASDDTFFIHWASGCFDEPGRAPGSLLGLRMAHSWGGRSTAFYAEQVRRLPDVRPSTVLIHEWGHCLGLVGVDLSEAKPGRAHADGGHCPDPACVMYRAPLAQESFCEDCLEALAHAPERGLVNRLLDR
jgi:hypothetical protein